MTEARDDADRPIVLAGLLTRLGHHQRTIEARLTAGAAEMRLLWLLRDGEGRTIRQLADELGREQSTVNRQVNAAEQAGLLERHDVEGLRAHVFRATPVGYAVLEENLRFRLGPNEVGLAALGERAGDFLDLFSRFIDAYGEAAQDAVPAVHHRRP